MSRLEDFSTGIQLAHENLGRRPTRFMANANFQKLDQIRQKFDPTGLFRAWRGRLGERDDESL